MDKMEESRTIFQRNPKKTLVFFLLLVIGLLDLAAGFLFIPPRLDTFRTPHHYYHHGFLPSQQAEDEWFSRKYPLYTNSLAMRDSRAREIPLSSSKKRILLLGDSFLEGKGVTYEESVAGIVQKNLQSKGVEILNAAAVSYSPRIYYLKARYLLEEEGLDVDEIVVFIDISDIQNEIVYQNFQPTTLGKWKLFSYRAAKFMNGVSFLFHSIHSLRGDEDIPDLGQKIFDNPFMDFSEQDRDIVRKTYDYGFISSWTFDRNAFDLYGRRGLDLAQKNITRLLELCRKKGVALKLAVYPWPQQLLRKELGSLQVKYWEDFCRRNAVPFINLFPSFINKTHPMQVYKEHFILKDVHWNRKGNELVASSLLQYL